MPASAGRNGNVYCGPLDRAGGPNPAALRIVGILVKNPRTGEIARVPISIFESDPNKAAKKAKAQGRKFYGEGFAGIVA